MFVKPSEQPSLYNDLEKKSVREILEDINTEDQKVALAVQRAIPQIEKLVTQIVPRMKQGGRIFYMDAPYEHSSSPSLGPARTLADAPSPGVRVPVDVWAYSTLRKFHRLSVCPPRWLSA